jgi:RsiW-degrading membrane proteinase PrsW (M82 family)
MLASSGALIAAGIVLNVVVSALLGVAVYFFGRRRHHTLAVVGLVVTILLGILLGFVLAIISAIIFVIAIWATARRRQESITA